VARALEGLGLKHRLKPHLIELLDLLNVPHGLTPDPKVFRQLPRLRGAIPAAATGGPRVLVSSFRGAWLLHGTLEALLAEALGRRGARPTVFVCSGGLPLTLPGRAPACGISNVHDTRVFSCANCLRCGLTLAGALALPVLRLDELMDGARMRDLAAPLEPVGPAELATFRHRELPIGPWAATMTRWYLCRSEWEGVPEGAAVLRHFVQAGVILAEAMPLLLDRARPDVVVLLNGLFLAERILREEAQRRGIRVVTYEHGQAPDTYCFSDGIANHYDVGALWEEVKDRPLTASEDAELDGYLESRRRGLPGINPWAMTMGDDAETRARLRLDDRPVALLFTNVTWDSAAQDRDVGFRGMFDWVAETVHVFEGLSGAQLVIRIHPAEVGYPGWETLDPLLPRLRGAFPTLPENVRVVPPEDPLSSYALMALARCGLVYTSTAGLEMAMAGSPAVVAGDVHYRGKGFTLDTEGPADYGERVRTALAQPRDHEVAARARRYGYALFFRYFHPFPVMSENYPDLIPTLNTADPRALDPGGDPTLDFICGRILRGGPFHVPSATVERHA
jgi:hypothetical protein